MGRKKKQDKDQHGDAKVHKELKGLKININPFGEIETNYDINKINDFLNEHVEDKKLKEREELKRKGLSKDTPKPSSNQEQGNQGGKQTNDKTDKQTKNKGQNKKE